MRPASPYRGLAPFEDTELDELFFFGRELDREVIAANLVASRLTVLYGPSGVGKSSALRAGVARDLRDLPERPLVIVHDVWGEDPALTLPGAIANAAGVEAATLAEALEDAAAIHGDVYILLDQVEAYFVYHGADRALGEAVGALVGRSELPVHILLSIREDALARLDAFKGQLPGLFANRLRLEHLSRDAGRRAITGPIERFAGFVPDGECPSIEPELVEAVLDGVRAGAVVQAGRGRGLDRAAASRARIEAPYLQLVMQRLWEVESAAGSPVLRLSTLQELGGPARIVEQHLERALASLTPAQKALAARMFNHLVTPSGMKVSHGTVDLAGYAGTTPDELAPVLSTLGRERILRPVEDAGGSGHEIFHDVLADAVLGWRGRFEAEQRFEHERAAARRRHRRLGGLAAGLIVAVAAMAAVTVFALNERSDARRNAADARARQASEIRQEHIAGQQRRAAQLAAANALHQAQLARRAENHARKLQHQATLQATIADAQRRRADSQSRLADQQKRQAEEQRRLAEQQKRNATTQRGKAVHESALAHAAQRSAQTQATLAEQRARQAAAARASALAAATEAKAREFAYNALALLPSDPDQSLYLATRAADLEPSLPLAESTLRDALLAAHALRVLRANGAPARAGLFVGGPGRTHDAEFSPDGTLVVTSGDSDARIFRSDTGRLMVTLQTGARVADASFALDGRRVVTAGADGRALVWDAGSGDILLTLRHSGPVTAAHFSPDGRLIATTSSDHTAKLWDANSGAQLFELGHPQAVLGEAFSPDSSRLVTFTNDRIARVWDTASGNLLLSLTQASTVTDARFSPSGDLIATTGLDGTARLWNAHDGSLTQTLQARGDLLSSAFSPDGSSLLTVGSEGNGRVWDVATGALETLLVGHETAVNSAAFSPDGNWMITAGTDGSARLFSFPDGHQQAELLAHRDAVVSVSFSASGATAVTASDDGTAIVWDTQVEPALELLGSHDGAANGLSFSPDGSSLASAGTDGTLKIWSIARRDVLRTMDAGAALEDVAFSSDGKLVAGAETSGDASIWTTASGALDGDFKQKGAVHAVALSPNGKLLATAGADKTARIITVVDGGTVVFPHPAAVNDVAFSPKGDLLATACADGLARIWSVGSGELVHTLAAHTDSVTSVAFSSDGRLLVTASRDHDVRIWNVATGAMMRLLQGHASFVSDAGFSADGRWVVSAGPAKAGIWATSATDLPGDRLYFLVGHTGPLTAAAFAPRGFLLATAGTDGTVRTFTCRICGTTPELVALAKKRLAQLGSPS